MNTRMFVAAVLAAVVAGAPDGARAQQALYPVAGVVRAASGTPVAGATVSTGAGGAGSAACALEAPSISNPITNESTPRILSSSKLRRGYSN